MAIFWSIGSIFYFLINETKLKNKPNYSVESHGITFLLSCFNEEETIKDTIENILSLKYKTKELIVINDGSSDNTADVIKQLQSHLSFKLIDLKENKGKANALNQGLKIANNEFVMCIDADTIIDDDAPYYMVEDLLKNESVGAVTGNPRIRNKSSLLGKIQTVEYSSIIGGIKRAQSVVGKINTISGVFTLFRKSAVVEVNGWDTDMITEDIAISWKLHLKDWSIKYEPRALCWMLVPETLLGLWNQRIRWAQGGHEVLIRDLKGGLKTFNIRIYILLFEQLLSLVWIYIIVILLAYTILNTNFLDFYNYEYNFTVFLLSAFVLTFINLIQFAISMFIDNKYEKQNILVVLFLSWYPTFYWMINALVSVVAFPKAIKRKKGGYAVWTSPDRGNIKH
ncbi:poly-beta-1,6-N-acetyl-D-glucosamine synthase [Staphylococcus gallinarum]|nr:poly-beta-1,6-N-acetyl-D-glucosamine synthase [Staphylococcus gallinarum]